VTGVTDTAGNQGEETVTSANYSVDTEIPTLVSIGMDDQAIKVDDKAIVSFTFSEAVSNFSTANVNVENGSIGVLMNKMALPIRHHLPIIQTLLTQKIRSVWI